MSTLSVATLTDVTTLQSSTTSPPTFQNSAGTEIGTLCRAWVNFNGLSGSVGIRQSFNVSSVTRNATGNYTISFTNALVDSSYCAVGVVRDEDGGGTPSIYTPETTNTRTTTAYQFMCRAGGSNTAIDTSEANVAVFR